MTKCDHCNEAFNAEREGLQLSAAGTHVAAVCGACCKDVGVAKLVIRKADVGGFCYDQWSPMEMTTSRLTTPKRVG